MSITGKTGRSFLRQSFGFALTLFLGINCIAQGQLPVRQGEATDKALLEKWFADEGGIFDSIRLHRIGWNVQVIYTEIDRKADSSAVLKPHAYNANPAAYFYPSTSIALPLSILALQKLHGLEKFGVNRNSTIVFEGGGPGQKAMYNDPLAPDGRPTIEGLIIRALGEGDEYACSRLYEFLGRDYIREQLLKRGYDSTQILHRLVEPLKNEDQSSTNPLAFYGADKQLLYSQPMQIAEKSYPGSRADFIGQGYYDDTLLMSPMNFSLRNRFPLSELHDMFSGLNFPATQPAKKRFDITAEEQSFLVKCISQPKANGTGNMRDSSYDYAYTKFIFGREAKKDALTSIRTAQLIGAGLGQLTAAAYVRDQSNQIEFLVSLTIYCNGDNILNDDEYDYDSIGLPFLQSLSEMLMRKELEKRKKKRRDL